MQNVIGSCYDETYMGAVITQRKDQGVRLNNADWKVLKAFSDGKRHTSKHLFNSTESLSDISYEYVRQRVNHLYDNAMIDRVDESQMYEISDLGRSALELEDEYDDLSPREFGELVRDHAREETESDS
jgi:RIO-like serine/threonine protein kinase